jgi:endonuclease-3
MRAAPFSVADRAAAVCGALFSLYPTVEGFLNYDTPFQLLVAVVLSARCSDARVNGVTAKLFADAPTAHEICAMPLQLLEEIIHPLGFFHQKARALSGLSKKLVKEFSGAVPLNFSDLESLPGVGHKTASVVMGQLTSVPTFPVDTHVWRLAKRWGLSCGKNAMAVERDLKNLFQPTMWMGLHLRMIKYGRLRCTARMCDGTKCEICRLLELKKLR